MVSPVDALGVHALPVRDLLVTTIQDLHDRFVFGHEVTGTRYGLSFGTQWRDLLDDVHDALSARGFRAHKPATASYRLPVVNDSLVFVWRVPGTPNAVTQFASSPARQSAFAAPLLDPVLFEPDLGADAEQQPEASNDPDGAEVERLLGEVGAMPLVLVMVRSSPRQLQSIEWAVAELDDEGRVRLHGQEVIWQPVAEVEDTSSGGDAFDSGEPVSPSVGLREQDAIWPQPVAEVEDTSSEVEAFDSGEPVSPPVEPREQEGTDDAG